MDPIEVKQALGLSSAPTSVESKDPSENIEKAQLQEDPHTVVTEYLNNVDSTELLQEFETDLTKSCIIDFEVSKSGIKPIMKNRNKLNDYINEYKETRLDELVTFLQSAGYNVYENRNQSSAELSKKARHALQLF